MLLVDWGNRGPDWGEQLTGWCPSALGAERPRVVLFGPMGALKAALRAAIAFGLSYANAN
jgi:hypothetical protein